MVSLGSGAAGRSCPLCRGPLPKKVAFKDYLEDALDIRMCHFLQPGLRDEELGVILKRIASSETIHQGYAGTSYNMYIITRALEGTGLAIEVLENREGQIQTKDGLKPSTTLVLLAKRGA
jgi:hypothetical protein